MLTSLLLKWTVPGMGKELSPASRTRCGIVSGIVGIICNIFLVIVKVILAIFTGSIAVAADAVNNLSDAGSGIITVVGFRISSQPPDAEHPFGHGRTEYVAGLVVALLIVGLGVSFLKDSIASLFHPEKLDVSTVMIVIFSATVLVKCWLFFFYRKVAKLIKSDVVRAAAYDSLSDCLGTGLVIAALIVSRFTDFPVDGCAGIIVALLILWAGAGVLKDTVNKLLGEPPDPELVTKLRETILACPGIDGVHDIMIHNYGENSYYVTAHAEISCDGDRYSAHDILENAEVVVAQSLPVHLLLHGDPYSKSNPEVIYWRSRMENEVAKFDSELKLYDFRLGKDEAGEVVSLSFHLLIPHRYGMTEAEIRTALQERMRAYKDGLELEITFLKSFI
ncbi:MAG: cation transporter [Lentisphaeria bacterium]|nr:cation transporter [Lentisphaeria bacterium]